MIRPSMAIEFMTHSLKKLSVKRSGEQLARTAAPRSSGRRAGALVPPTLKQNAKGARGAQQGGLGSQPRDRSKVERGRLTVRAAGSARQVIVVLRRLTFRDDRGAGRRVARLGRAMQRLLCQTTSGAKVKRVSRVDD